MGFQEIAKEFGTHVLFTNAWERLKQIGSILGRSEPSEESVYDRSTLAAIFPAHRMTVRDKFYDEAFKSGREVLYVSIMSRDTLGDTMRDNLTRAIGAGTQLKVLTWNPKVGQEVVEAFRKHLGEFEDDRLDAFRQVQSASREWAKMARDFRGAITEVRVYDSVPTLQGIIVKDDWALIELLPYRTKKEERPAIFVSARFDKDLYSLFEHQFGALWEHSKRLQVRIR